MAGRGVSLDGTWQGLEVRNGRRRVALLRDYPFGIARGKEPGCPRSEHAEDSRSAPRGRESLSQNDNDPIPTTRLLTHSGHMAFA